MSGCICGLRKSSLVWEVSPNQRCDFGSQAIEKAFFLDFILRRDYLIVWAVIYRGSVRVPIFFCGPLRTHVGVVWGVSADLFLGSWGWNLEIHSALLVAHYRGRLQFEGPVHHCSWMLILWAWLCNILVSVGLSIRFWFRFCLQSWTIPRLAYFHRDRLGTQGFPAWSCVRWCCWIFRLGRWLWLVPEVERRIAILVV